MSTIDPRDHPFILGSTNPAMPPLNDLMIAAEQQGKTGADLEAIEDTWTKQAGLKSYEQAVVDAVNAGVHLNKEKLIQDYKKQAKGKSLSEQRAIAKTLTGVDVYFDWDAARTREGYYRFQGGAEPGAVRAIAFAPYADMIWMESKKPDFEQAKFFADMVHAAVPHQK